SVCDLPPETGRCRAAITKYFYNSTSGYCEEFIYGGCEGNENRFDNITACKDQCPIQRIFV
ncbi:unnamed protein product, partial [Candidula unifasciata]